MPGETKCLVSTDGGCSADLPVRYGWLCIA